MKKNSNDINDYPDADLLFPGRYIKSAEVKLSPKPVPLTLLRIEPRHELQRTKGGSEYKPALFFKETDKGFVLNKTNNKRLKEALGPDPRKWIGCKVVIGVERVDSFGQKVDGMRVNVDKTKAANSGRQVQQPEPSPEQESSWSKLETDIEADEQALADAAREAEQQG